MVALGLRCFAWAFSSCGKWVLLFVVGHGLLIAVAALVVDHQTLDIQILVVVAHGLSSCSTWALGDTG